MKNKPYCSNELAAILYSETELVHQGISLNEQTVLRARKTERIPFLRRGKEYSYPKDLTDSFFKKLLEKNDE